jgi:hypothetical protein
MRITIAALLALSLSAFGQGPGPGRGPGPRRGFDAAQGPGGPGARFLGAEAGMPGRTVKGAPYSAEVVTESSHTLADGNHIKQSATSKVYRDSEGRTRREQAVNLSGLAQNANMPNLVFIHDPVAGADYALNAKDRTGSKSTFTARDQSMHAQRTGSGPRQGDSAAAGAGPMPRRGSRNSDQNIKTETLGKQTIEGVQAEGRRTTMTIPAGQMGNELPIQIVTETWYSPELQTMVLSKHSDPRNGDTVTKLMNISRSEPSRMLFEAPADYKVTESQRGGPRPRTGGPGQDK